MSQEKLGSDSHTSIGRMRHRARSLSYYYLYSSSDKDRKLRQDFSIRLEALRQNELLNPFCIDNCQPGDDAESIVRERISISKIISPLISPDYLASKEHYDQLRHFIDKQKAGQLKIIPIIIRPTVLPSEIFGLECFPLGRQPVSTWRNQDLAWQNICQGLTKAVLEVWYPPNNFEFSVEAGTSKQYGSALLVLKIDPGQINQNLLMDILLTINSISPDFSMKLSKVTEGSTMLMISGTLEEINRMYFEVRYNGLRAICGIEIDTCIPLVENLAASQEIDTHQYASLFPENFPDQQLREQVITMLLSKEVSPLIQRWNLERRTQQASSIDLRTNDISVIETICDDLDEMVKITISLGLAARPFSQYPPAIRTRFSNSKVVDGASACIALERFDIAIKLREDSYSCLIADWRGILSVHKISGIEMADLISREFSLVRVISYLEGRGFSVDSISRGTEEIRIIGVSWSSGRRKTLEAHIDRKGEVTYREGSDPIEEVSELNTLKGKS